MTREINAANKKKEDAAAKERANREKIARVAKASEGPPTPRAGNGG
jgi:hypothetical protein